MQTPLDILRLKSHERVAGCEVKTMVAKMKELFNEIHEKTANDFGI